MNFPNHHNLLDQRKIEKKKENHPESTIIPIRVQHWERCLCWSRLTYRTTFFHHFNGKFLYFLVSVAELRESLAGVRMGLPHPDRGEAVTKLYNTVTTSTKLYITLVYTLDVFPRILTGLQVFSIFTAYRSISLCASPNFVKASLALGSGSLTPILAKQSPKATGQNTHKTI